MKKILGKFLIGLLFLLGYMHASQLCDYKVKVSNHSPYVKESVEVIFEAVQKEHSSVMFFDLMIQKSDAFEAYLVEKLEDKKSYHDNKTTYKYILYPLKSEKIELDFDFKVSLASDESIEKFYTGNRDVINPMATKEVHIDVAPTTLEVHALGKAVDLIGDFTLTSEIDKKEVEAFEQVNVRYTVKGQGYIPRIKSVLPQIEGVQQFLERTGKPMDFIKGGKLSFQYALLAKQDFDLPSVKIRCFSPIKKRYYTLSTLVEKIDVSSIEYAVLLDAEDSHPVKTFVKADYLSYLNGVLLFLAGFAVAKISPMLYRRRKVSAQNPLQERIKRAKDEKALLQLLLGTTDPIYKPYITMLEETLYGHKSHTLKSIKDALLKQ
ncbi:MAG: BatD family protein [Epsilonproteobacteria bacterium]|nr:BatD family protein [Campylobacterota bacterium]